MSLHLVELAEQPMQEAFFAADGVFVRRIIVRGANVLIPQHYHKHDHNTLIAAGKVRAWRSVRRYDELVWGEEPQMMLLGDFADDDNDMILIEAGYHHKFLTLSEFTKICCLHNTHGEDAEVIIAEAPALAKD